MARRKIEPKYFNFKVRSYLSKCTDWKYINEALLDPSNLNVTCWSLLFIEALIGLFVIWTVRYTEIDWIAYMQEVEGFLNGTLDYKLLRGDTGPLVYPAGFVYTYSALYFITSQGQNVKLAQYIFLLLYLVHLLFVFRIYKKTAKVAPYAVIISCLTSYRIHSIYMLRLFNDPIAVLLFYVALNAFVSNKWLLGSVFYSFAVSIKMNVLLYAPCLLMTYLTNLKLHDAFINLAVCGLVQLMLGAPFLLANPKSYLMSSFDLGRVFEHKWTVNYRFLSRDVFENRYFHVGLLVLHVLLLLLFLPYIKRYLQSYARLNKVALDVRKQLKSKKRDRKVHLEDHELEFTSKSAQLIVLPFFVTNLIGVASARSLHYQFYSWYFHSLPYLAFCTGLKKPAVFLLLGVIELCWNVYPSTSLSSASLHICHLVLLSRIFNYMRK